MAIKRGFFCKQCQCSGIPHKCASGRKIVGLIRDVVRQEVAAELDRQSKIENAVWLNCFSNALTAKPREQQARVMRMASGRAALAILDDSK